MFGGIQTFPCHKKVEKNINRNKKARETKMYISENRGNITIRVWLVLSASFPFQNKMRKQNKEINRQTDR